MSKKILILGAKSVIGSILYIGLPKSGYDVYATVENDSSLDLYFPNDINRKIITNISAQDLDSVTAMIDKIRPDIVVNCISLAHQSPMDSNIEMAIYLNALFPHKLAKICEKSGARMVHLSTDCVFSGEKGNYKEDDVADAKDIYGRTRYLGEVIASNCLTLRLSAIGHDIEDHSSLVDWFLSQEGEVNGLTGAIYSGFPSIEIVKILASYVIPNDDLKGLYHISSEPISKFDLLMVIKKIYNKQIKINPSSQIVSDKSLDSTKFKRETGYEPPSWERLAKEMYLSYKSNPNFIKY